jgi:HEAT repeat protein
LSTNLDHLNNKDAQVRSQAILKLGQAGVEEAIPKLASILLNDSSPEVRRCAAQVLGELASLKNTSVCQSLHG